MLTRKKVQLASYRSRGDRISTITRLHPSEITPVNPEPDGEQRGRVGGRRAFKGALARLGGGGMLLTHLGDGGGGSGRGCVAADVRTAMQI